MVVLFLTCGPMLLQSMAMLAINCWEITKQQLLTNKFVSWALYLKIWTEKHCPMINIAFVETFAVFKILYFEKLVVILQDSDQLKQNISLNVLLSCDQIGQLCVLVASVIGGCRHFQQSCRHWYYKEIDFMTFIAFAETIRTVQLLGLLLKE